MLNPKALVLTLSAVNLLIGAGLGIALDRTVLPCDQRDPVTEQAPTSPPEIGDGPTDTKDDRKVGRPHENSRDGHRRGGRSEWLKRTLDLDDEQSEQVMAIMQARRPKFEEVFQQVRPKLKALEEETHAEILKILRPAQVMTFEEMRKRFGKRGLRGRRSSRRGPRGWGGRDGRGDERGQRKQPKQDEEGDK